MLKIPLPTLANAGDEVKTTLSLFKGNPLHIFLLDELVSLDKLDVLELPDDFKYKGEAFSILRKIT
ncbi:MAG: hypothetical protein U0Z17_00040 [Bacteroidales bacterium]